MPTARSSEQKAQWLAFIGEAATWRDLPLWLPVALGVGIGFYFSLNTEPPAMAGLVGVLTAGVALAQWHRTAAAPCLVLLLCAAVGFLAAQHRTRDVAAPILASSHGPAEVKGTVIRWEAQENGHGRLTLGDLGVEGLLPDQTPARIRIVVRTGGDAVWPGDRVSLRAVLQPAPKPAFPDDFDYARVLYFEQIGALGFSVAPVNRLERSPVTTERSVSGTGRIAMEGLRARVSDRIRHNIPGQTGAVADAVITGHRQALSDKVTGDMRGSGLAHLLAISGLHVGLVTGLVFLTVRAGLALVPSLAVRYPIKKWAAAAAIPVAAFYLVLSGSGIPATRAFLMASLVLLAVILDRNPISLRMVALAAGAILLMSPEVLLSASFQMSFSAVAGLVAAYAAYREYRLRKRRLAEPLGVTSALMAGRRGWSGSVLRYFIAVIMTTLIAEVVLAPSILYHFNRLALYSLAGNLVAMPLMAFWIMPAGLLGMVLMPLGLDKPAFMLMGEGIALMLGAAAAVHDTPGAEIPVPAFSSLAYGVIMAAFIALVLVRGRARWIALPLVVLGLLLAVGTPRPDLLVDDRGQVMAVTAPDGRYWFSPGRAGLHARRMASERSGQQDHPRWEWGSDTGEKMDWLNCDAQGCLYRPPVNPDLSIALLNDPMVASEDCARADVVVSLERLGAVCRAASLVIDWGTIRARGGHAVYLGRSSPGQSGAIRVETVADRRGERPWVR